MRRGCGPSTFGEYLHQRFLWTKLLCLLPTGLCWRTLVATEAVSSPLWHPTTPKGHPCSEFAPVGIHRTPRCGVRGLGQSCKGEEPKGIPEAHQNMGRSPIFHLNVLQVRFFNMSKPLKPSMLLPEPTRTCPPNRPPPPPRHRPVAPRRRWRRACNASVPPPGCRWWATRRTTTHDPRPTRDQPDLAMGRWI